MVEDEKPVPFLSDDSPNDPDPSEGLSPVDPAAESAVESIAAEVAETAPLDAVPPEPAPVDRRRSPRGPRPETLEAKEPFLRESGGYRLRLEPADLARLRELPGSKGKTDRELGETFLDGQAERLLASLAGDVAPPAEVRVVVDPYSRQAFLAVGRTIRGIVSF
jgi:hypothetical protein